MARDPWRMLWSAPGAAAELASALDALAAGAPPAAAEPVKRNPVREVIRVPFGAGDAAYLKCESASGRTRRWRARLGQAATAQEMRNLRRLQALGIAAVEPLLCAERWTEDGTHHGLLATRALPDARVLRHALETGPSDERARWLAALVKLLRRLHDAGFWHRDLHAGNALVTSGADPVVLVDVQKLRRWPAPLPWRMRALDLGLLADDLSTTPQPPSPQQLVASYAAAGTALPDAVKLEARTAAAAARRRQRRLRSRGQRCMRRSSGFRVERNGGRRVFRRADVELDSVLEALALHARAGVGAGATSRHAGLLGGPPPGPPPEPSSRGHGRPEPGAPARGGVTVREFPLRSWQRLASRFGVDHTARRAWRGAHALLLRRFDTPAPLALVEDASGIGPGRAWVLVRDEPDATPWRPDSAELDRLVESLLRAGIRYRRGSLRLSRRRGSGDVLVDTPEALRFVPSRTASAVARSRLRAALPGDGSVG